MNQSGQDSARKPESILTLPDGAPAKLPAVLMFGMPGVGKGTQGSLLGTMNGMFHVSTGTIFRNLDPESADGKLIFGLIDRITFAFQSKADHLTNRFFIFDDEDTCRHK